MEQFDVLFNQPRRTPTARQRHIEWYTTDSLRYREQPELPLVVDVSTASTESGVVVYNCTSSSATATRTWRVSHRYSEFVDFHSRLEDLWTCHDANCAGSCQALRDIVAAYFPKKRLPAMSKTQGATTSRQAKFRHLLTHLLRSLLLPGSVLKCLHARQHLPQNVFEFLGVESSADRRSLLQVFVDNYQAVVETSDGASEGAASDTTECMICLGNVGTERDNQRHGVEGSDTDSSDEDRDDEDNVQVIIDSHDAADSAQVVLPCKHAFHRTCIFQWLLVEFRCPVCRANLCPSAFTNYCRVRRCKPQWWLSDFEKDLLRA
jgi:hypothetical protein